MFSTAAPGKYLISTTILKMYVSHTENIGYLPFTWENRKFQLEKQMVRAIPFGKIQKIWAVIWDDAIFLLF